jgi:hypothetical protein
MKRKIDVFPFNDDAQLVTAKKLEDKPSKLRNATPKHVNDRLPNLYKSIDHTTFEIGGKINCNGSGVVKLDDFNSSLNISPTIGMSNKHIKYQNRNQTMLYSSAIGNYKPTKLMKIRRFNQSPDIKSIFTVPRLFPDLKLGMNSSCKKEIDFKIFDSRHLSQHDFLPETAKIKPKGKNRLKIKKLVENEMKKIKESKVGLQKNPTFLTNKEVNEEEHFTLR